MGIPDPHARADRGIRSRRDRAEAATNSRVVDVDTGVGVAVAVGTLVLAWATWQLARKAGREVALVDLIAAEARLK